MSQALDHMMARLQEISVSDAEINAELACLFIHKDLRPARPDDFDGKFGYHPGNIKTEHGFLQADRFTSSIDSALQLATRLLPGVWWHIAKGKEQANEPLFGAALMFGETAIGQGESDHSPAIAICIAIVDAMQRQDTK